MTDDALARTVADLFDDVDHDSGTTADCVIIARINTPDGTAYRIRHYPPDEHVALGLLIVGGDIIRAGLELDRGNQ